MTKISQENLIKLRRAESSLSKHLFLICTTITIIVMAMFVIEFFSRGSFFPSRIGFFYIGVLLVYSLHKEMLRWLEEKREDRRGEYFLYSWIGLTTVFYVVNFLTRDYFSMSLEGKPIGCASEISLVTLEVAGVFLLTRLSKVVKTILMKR
jgi:hypothetical protein